MRRGMTKAEFAAACKRRGFVPHGFMGYYRLADANGSVSIWNAGPGRREQLAYLIREYDRAMEQRAKAQATK